jgi:hypothetical protein
MRAWGFGLAICLALAAPSCGPKATAVQASSAQSDEAASKAALDPCAGMFQALCKDKDLAALGGQMKSALANAAAAVSPQGLKVLAANEQSWLQAQRVACAIAPGATALNAAQAACLKSAFESRAKAALQAVEQRGPFTFQRVEVNQADKVAPGGATHLMGADAPAAVSHAIQFPRIDGDGPIVQKFNSAVQQAPRFKPADQTEESTTYQIGYVGADLVSVKFDLRDLTVGAAHPNASVKAVTFNMRTGARLSAADMFKPRAKWQDFLAVRAARDITKQLRDQDETARAVDPSDARDAAIDPNSWFVTDKALVLLFPPGALGLATAMDAYEVSIPWRDLKPYLNPQGPGPIKSA